MSGSDGFWFLFAAYGAFWAILAWFLMRLGRRHGELERELKALETRVNRSPTV